MTANDHEITWAAPVRQLLHPGDEIGQRGDRFDRDVAVEDLRALGLELDLALRERDVAAVAVAPLGVGKHVHQHAT